MSGIHPFARAYMVLREQAGDRLIDALQSDEPGARMALRAFVRADWSPTRIPADPWKSGWTMQAKDRLYREFMASLEKVPESPDRRDAFERLVSALD